jgi:hypothetical protein
MFETGAAQVQYNLFEDLARNIDSNISQYLKDDLAVRHLFVCGDDDFMVYRKGTRNWLESTISFVESAKFKPLNLTVPSYLIIVIQLQRKSSRLHKSSNTNRIFRTD